MTPEERILWRLLRARRLNGMHFRRQQVIDGFIVDFYCHAAGLVVEIDGGIHAEQQEYDAERDRVLSARGLRILRVTNEDVRRDAATVLRRIAAACREGFLWPRSRLAPLSSRATIPTGSCQNWSPRMEMDRG
jgi:very-short-patch-repair endonuclease